MLYNYGDLTFLAGPDRQLGCIFWDLFYVPKKHPTLKPQESTIEIQHLKNKTKVHKTKVAQEDTKINQSCIYKNPSISQKLLSAAFPRSCRMLCCRSGLALGCWQSSTPRRGFSRRSRSGRRPRPLRFQRPRRWFMISSMEKPPEVSKGCCLEVFKYLKTSKKHGTFVTPGIVFVPSSGLKNKKNIRLKVFEVYKVEKTTTIYN